jgi:hypothetical protein
MTATEIHITVDFSLVTKSDTISLLVGASEILALNREIEASGAYSSVGRATDF